MSGTGFNTSFGTGHFAAAGTSSGAERKQQVEYKKIFCAYHSTEFLTNFCTDSNKKSIKRSVSCLCAQLV